MKRFFDILVYTLFVRSVFNLHAIMFVMIAIYLTLTIVFALWMQNQDNQKADTDNTGNEKTDSSKNIFGGMSDVEAKACI